MILFFSDMHFGQSDYAREREKERALVQCLRVQEEAVERLYLLGDVFDAYIEYDALIPKGFVRFQGLLAEWTDRGVPITYLVGNHDPWHLEYFERELGVTVVNEAQVEPLYGRSVYMAHGDGIHEAERLSTWLRPWIRHPVNTWLYRHLLPGDAGLRLARWVSQSFGEEREPEKAVALRRHARKLLRSGAADAVVMGHSHLPEQIEEPDGCYVNTGSWYGEQTFARLNADGLRLARWNGQQVIEKPAVGTDFE